MQNSSIYHITYKNERWTVRKQGRRFVDFLSRSKEHALKWGAAMAQVRFGRLIIHDTTGQIEAHQDYSDGPQWSLA